MDEAELLQIRSEQYQRNAAVELLARDHDGDDDDDQMEFRATISSELPVTRWFGREILDHTDASIRMGRLNGGAAVLDRHHGDQDVGQQPGWRVVAEAADQLNVEGKQSGIETDAQFHQAVDA